MSEQMLRAKRLGIDTCTEPVLFLRADSPVTRSEGFEVRAQVLVRARDREIVAVLMVVNTEILALDEVGLSENAWRALSAREGERVTLAHMPPLRSFALVRDKIAGARLSGEQLSAIVSDIAAGRYADIHLSAFLTACAARGLDIDEMIALTRAMLGSGETMRWGASPVVDKHCVGGLPGNRTTPIVVAIVAAAGLLIPKTSSRAITSPAGTADTMEVFCPVTLSVEAMRTVVEREGGCVVWGGAMRLVPVDGTLIRVERPLGLDSHGQVVASIVSKKLAAGSTHALIDLPVGPSAKIHTPEIAARLAADLVVVGAALGLEIRCAQTDGRQPVGRGVGPANEARDVLSVLRRERSAPSDLAARAAHLAGLVLELSGTRPSGTGEREAWQILHDGLALRKFYAICEAQGCFREPATAPLTRPVLAPHSGTVTAIDNQRLANVAKFAGAPLDKVAGLVMEVRLGDRVERNQPLFTVHAASRGELGYALDYVAHSPGIVSISG